MGKLMVHQFVSLDGYAADADGAFSLFENGEARTPEFDLELLVRLQLVDAILLGATTYRMFADYWPTSASVDQIVAPAVNTIEKIVFSSTLDAAPWGEYAPARLESGDAVDAIRRLKDERFGDLLVWGSLSLTDDLFAAGLVDSVRIAVLPVILGSGRSAFPNGFSEREVRLIATNTFDNSIVATEYSVGSHVPTVTGALAAPVEVPDVAPEPEPEPLPERLFESDTSGEANELPLPEQEAPVGDQPDVEGTPGNEPDSSASPEQQPNEWASAEPASSEQPAPDQPNAGWPAPEQSSEWAGAEPAPTDHPVPEQKNEWATSEPASSDQPVPEQSSEWASADSTPGDQPAAEWPAPEQESAPDQAAGDWPAPQPATDRNPEPAAPQQPAGWPVPEPSSEWASSEGFSTPPAQQSEWASPDQTASAGPESGFDWQVGTATPEESPSTESVDAANAETPQVDDSATVENPPQDPEEAERLVSRRKWD